METLSKQRQEQLSLQPPQPHSSTVPPQPPASKLNTKAVPPSCKPRRDSVRSNRSNSNLASKSAGIRSGPGNLFTPTRRRDSSPGADFQPPHLDLGSGALVSTVRSEGTDLHHDNVSLCSFGSQIETHVATSHPHLSHLVPLARGPTAYMDILNKCNDHILQDRMMTTDEKEILFSCSMKKKNKYGSSQRRDLVVTDGAMYICDKSDIKHRIALDQISGVLEDRDKINTFAVLVPSLHDFLLTVSIDDQPASERRQWAALINEERTLKMYALAHLAVAHCTTLDNMPFVLDKVKDVKERIRRKAHSKHNPLIPGKYDYLRLASDQEVCNSLGGFGETSLKMSCRVMHVDQTAAEKERFLLVSEYAIHIVSARNPGHRKQRIDVRQINAIHQASLMVLIKVPTGDTLCIFQEQAHVSTMTEALNDGRCNIFKLGLVVVHPCTEDDIRHEAHLAKVKKGNVQKLLGFRKSRLSRSGLHSSSKGLGGIGAASFSGKGIAEGMKKRGLAMISGDVAKALGGAGSKGNPVVFPAAVPDELLSELNRLASFPRDEKEVSRMKSVKSQMGMNGDTAVWLSAEVYKMSLEKGGKEDPRTLVVADRNLYILKGKKNELKCFHIADIHALVFPTDVSKSSSPCLLVFSVGSEHDLLINLGACTSSGPLPLKDLLYAHLLKRKSLLGSHRSGFDKDAPDSLSQAQKCASFQEKLIASSQDYADFPLYSVATEEDLRLVARKSKGDPLPVVAMTRFSHDVLCCGATAACVTPLRRFGESSVGFSDVGCVKSFSKSHPGKIKYKKVPAALAFCLARYWFTAITGVDFGG